MENKKKLHFVLTFWIIKPKCGMVPSIFLFPKESKEKIWVPIRHIQKKKGIEKDLPQIIYPIDTDQLRILFFV